MPAHPSAFRAELPSRLAAHQAARRRLAAATSNPATNASASVPGSGIAAAATVTRSREASSAGVHASIGGLSRPPHSHSIINGFCKPLIRLYDSSNRAGFAVRCTATATGIPACRIQHRSTSIENSRRLHDGQLSRSIGIYRLPATSATASTRVHLGQRHAQERLASRAVGYCSDSPFSQLFLPSGASIKARSEVSTEALACMTVCASAIR